MALTNVASPAYLARFGIPKTLEELDHHRLVHYAQTLGAAAPGWEYHDGERWRLRPMQAAITVTSTDAYEAACRAGLGLIQAPRPGMRAALADGRLVEVLKDFPGESMPVSLVYANRRNLSKRSQAFMDWLAEVIVPWLG